MNNYSPENLKEKRLKLGVSIERLAWAIQIPSIQIGSFETGKLKLSPESLLKIETYLIELEESD